MVRESWRWLWVALATVAAAAVIGWIMIALPPDWLAAAWAERGIWVLNVQDIEAFVDRWGAWSAIGSIVLMVLHSFVPLPAELIAIANGMMFGPLWGVAITWAGAMIGASCAFAVARYLGRPLGRHIVSERHWQEITNWRGRPVMLLLVRLIPVISFNLVNFAAGLTGIGWTTFLWTTGIGILPITVISVVLGDRLLSLPWPVWLAVGLGVVALWCVLNWIGRRRGASSFLASCKIALFRRGLGRADER
mgnify:CR=1 FL=1